MGSIITELNGNLTAIHDAIMPPLNVLNESANKYNEAYIEVGNSYSVIEEIQNQLKSAIKGVDLADEYYNEYYRTENKEKIDRREFIESTIKNFEKLSTTVKEARKELKKEIDKGVVVGHMASLEEGVYLHNVNPVDIKTEAAIIPDNISTDISEEAIAKANEMLDTNEANCKK